MTTKVGVQEEPAIYKVLRDGFVAAASVRPGEAAEFFRLGDIARTASGGTPRRDRPDFYGGSIPWVKSGELRDGIVLATEEAITEAAIEGSSAKIFPKGTVCVALYGATVGRVGVLGLDAATNQAVCGIFPSDELRPEYLRYFLFASRRRLVESGKGGAQPNISQQIVRDLRIPVPSTVRQREIVAYLDEQLSRLDASVATLHRVQANLKRYRASVLKSACEGRLVPTEAELARREGRDFETGTQLLQRVLAERKRAWASKRQYVEPVPVAQDELPPLPEGWAWAALDELAWHSSYGTSAKCSPTATGTAVLRIPNVDRGNIDTTDMKYSAEALDTESTAALKPGDMLIIRTNGSKALIGRGAIVQAPFSAPTTFASYLIRFRLMREVSQEWLGLFWQSPAARRWIEARASTSAGQHNVSMSVLATAPIPVPPLAEQHRIVAEADRRLSLIRVAEAQVSANLARAQRLRQAILSSAFAPEI